MLTYIGNLTYDITGCLQNCSNSGTCVFNDETEKIECDCDTGFYGSSCDKSKSLCSSSPCRNNGTCVDVAGNETGFYCICDRRYFYGVNCEWEVDVCTNLTCKNKGICKKNEETLEPECSCLKYYSGGECQVMSQTLKIIKNVISASSIIAIIIICLFYLMIIMCDVVGKKEKKKNLLKNK